MTRPPRIPKIPPLGGALAGALALAAGAAAVAPEDAAPPAAFVGASRCASCHAAMHEKWRGARHSKMLQPATPASVLGDFGQGILRLRGRTYRLRAEGGRYFVSESYLTGHEEERRIEYTLGSRRIQHYITSLPDGRMVVLPPTWDVQRREWIHNLDIVDPEETAETRVQVWNTNCYGCHVSQEEKNFDPATRSYATRWVDFGTSCERCHGPGSRHAERYATPAAAAGEGPSEIVRPTRLDAARSTMVCAQCHSLRDVTALGFTAGRDYYDYFLPILEYGQKVDKDPAYWPDGRPRRFSNDALGLWQSECFLKGQATCITCHLDPHLPDVDRNPQLAAEDNGVCLRCHQDLGRRLSEHTHHRAGSTGQSCVECHMPRTVLSIKARIRDHTISLPAPENTVRFGIPNACNECHRDRDAAWAARILAEWYPKGSRGKLVRRAEAFRGGRAGDPAALDGLLALAASASEGPLVRANAVGYLRKYPQPRVVAALLRALEDESPPVRAVAALTLAEMRPDSSSVQPALTRALGDDRRVVRVAAAFALVSQGIARLPGEDGRRLEAAKREYVSRAALLADDAETLVELGKFFYLDGRLEPSASAFSDALRLAPGRPGLRYLLGLTRLRQQRLREGRELLEQVPRGDPFYETARGLLKKLDGPS